MSSFAGAVRECVLANSRGAVLHSSRVAGSVVNRSSDRRIDDAVQQRELIDLIADRAAAAGGNNSPWAGLTYYRLDHPAPSHDEVVTSLSVCVVAQGRKRVQVGDRSHFCGPSDYFVMPQGARLVTDVLEATHDKPLLWIVLQIDPVLVAELLSEIEQSPGALPVPSEHPARREPAPVSPLGRELTGALLRFLRATDSDVDRRVLAPLALREAVYRVLRTAMWATLADAAHREMAGSRIATAITFMRAELDKPIKVQDMANHVSMSVSAFAHLFKATTGSAPYQYLKRLRLDRARVLLVEEHQTVSQACHTVGYGSVSHFITEFKRTYGDTPRSYANRLRRLGALHRSVAGR